MPKRFQIRAKQIFITYPQVKDDATFNSIADFLREQPASYGIYAREFHKDGNLHLHCALQYPDNINVNRQDYFDAAGQHPNVQGVRNWRCTVAYIRKEGDVTEWGVECNDSKRKTLIQNALENTSPHEAIKQYLESKSGSIRGYKSLIADYREFRSNELRSLLQPNPTLGKFDACTIGSVFSFIFKKHFKAKKLFIYGPPNTGKTTLLNQWDSNFCFQAPDNNDWSGFEPKFHKVIIFDEFHGQVPLSTLLKLMQGSKTRLNTKGGSIDCDVNLSMIFLSNIPPQNCYRNFAAFLTRLYVIEMTAFHSQIIFHSEKN